MKKCAFHAAPALLVASWRCRELQAHGKVFEVYTYPGADHGWTNVKGPAYRKEAAHDCWRRSIAFLRRHASNRTQIAVAGS